MNHKKKVVIIGARVAGLATAIRLSIHNQFEVTIIESNSYPGGKLSTFTQNGFRFDAGPSLFTLPDLIEDLIKLSGKKVDEIFPYIKLEKGCHYFYENGTQFISYHDKQKLQIEIRRAFNVDPEPFINYLGNAAKRYQITGPIFLEKSLHKLGTYLNKETLIGLLNISKLKLWQTMNEENEAIFNHPQLVQYFNRFATYNGSNPYNAPALLNMIPHLEHNIGTYFPKNGMHQITNTLFHLAQGNGVIFKFNEKVEEINIKNNKASEVISNLGKYKADIVISNIDIKPTYENLLKGQKQPKQILKQEKSSSAIIYYWGINRIFPQLDLHNIFFSQHYEKEFNCIFNDGSMFNDPTIYINITSKYNPQDAPKGCENWFVMVNAPSNSGQNWDSIIAETKQNVIVKLERMLKLDLRQNIVSESILDPRSIELKTGSFKGALYGNASNNKYAAFFRQSNFHHRISNLYFCGGSVHPGGGIPLCLQSGKIVSELILNRH